MDSAYSELLKDAFLSNFILTFKKDLAFETILYFGNHNEFICLALAVVGSVAGLASTYAIFYLVGIMLKSYLESGYSYKSFKDFVEKYPYFLLMFSAVPRFSIIPAVFVGIIKMNFMKFLSFIIFFRIIYYSVILYLS